MCAIVGVINSTNAAKTAYYALFSMQHRGQEASGISSCENGEITTFKGSGLVTDVFNETILSDLKGDMAIGHNRYATAGKNSSKDAQPIAANCALGQICVVHNGNLVNKDKVRKNLIDDGAIFQTNMDTENIVHLIAKDHSDNLQDRIKAALDEILGAYCLLIQSKDKIFAIRDKYGVRPLCLGRLRDGGYIVASETCAFDLLGAEFIRDIKPGEMLIFEHAKSEFKSIQLYEPEPRICAFEYIYFARPDSVIEGKSVYEVRKKMGEALAKKGKINAHFVVPVPDSGVPAALGYANASGIPFELAIIRNHYVGRTFIEPSQEVRNLKVKLKLNPMSSIIKNKKIVVVDDSIVRGTTSKKVVELLRQAGAKEIHFKVACPELKFPERYGIDTPSFEELISARKNVHEVCEFIGADSLEFLSIDELKQSIGNERKYSLVSFDGDYFIK